MLFYIRLPFGIQEIHKKLTLMFYSPPVIAIKILTINESRKGDTPIAIPIAIEIRHFVRVLINYK